MAMRGKDIINIRLTLLNAAREKVYCRLNSHVFIATHLGTREIITFIYMARDEIVSKAYEWKF